MTLGAALLALAVAVRAVPAGGAAHGPAAGGGAPAVSEPMQLLRAGGGHRVAELDRLVPEELRGRWLQARRAVAVLEGCPELAEWLDSSAGQRAEALVARLAAGTAEEAFAGLTLLFDLARRTSWAPGAFGSSHGAERLGDLLADWLAARAEGSPSDPLLREPALAAVLVYGRVMRVAFEGNLFSSSPPSLERARRRLEGWLGAEGRLTPFGAGLVRRYPDALAAGRDGSALLDAFAAEAALWFPELDGGCGD